MSHVFTTVIDDASISVTVFHRKSDYRQSEMEERTRKGAVGDDPSSSVIRTAPLLAVTGDKGERRVFVGNSRVVVSGVKQAAVEVYVACLWLEKAPDVFHLVTGGPDHQRDTELLLSYMNRKALDPIKAKGPTSAEHRAAAISKSLCEASRSSVKDLRELRYALEHRLAETSSASETSTDHTSVVSSLIQLNIMCGRASDEARESIREGLWVFVTDPEVYHAYRRLRDPTLVSEHETPSWDLRPWFRLHDAALRQCEELRKQLDGESASINTLIVAGASISSSKDADAQTKFNVLAAMASVGLGLPALILALYGASILLPMRTLPKLLAFAPVAVSLAIAGAIALHQGHRQRRGAIWNIGAIGIILVLLLLLLSAGYLAPELK